MLACLRVYECVQVHFSLHWSKVWVGECVCVREREREREQERERKSE